MFIIQHIETLFKTEELNWQSCLANEQSLISFVHFSRAFHTVVHLPLQHSERVIIRVQNVYSTNSVIQYSLWITE